jgi:Domain of unknown function (DUF4258)
MIYYTGHAKERMLLRGITQEMIKKALANPDKTSTGYDGRDLVFKKFPKGVIKVVFVKKKSSHIIISAIWHIIK